MNFAKAEERAEQVTSKERENMSPHFKVSHLNGTYFQIMHCFWWYAAKTFRLSWRDTGLARDNVISLVKLESAPQRKAVPLIGISSKLSSRTKCLYKKVSTSRLLCHVNSSFNTYSPFHLCFVSFNLSSHWLAC